VRGKLIRRSLKTTRISVAKLRLADFENQERQRAESSDEAVEGRLTFGFAAQIYLQRVDGSPN
jgi:hypothetical protein